MSVINLIRRLADDGDYISLAPNYNKLSEIENIRLRLERVLGFKTFQQAYTHLKVNKTKIFLNIILQ